MSLNRASWPGTTFSDLGANLRLLDDVAVGLPELGQLGCEAADCGQRLVALGLCGGGPGLALGGKRQQELYLLVFGKMRYVLGIYHAYIISS